MSVGRGAGRSAGRPLRPSCRGYRPPGPPKLSARVERRVGFRPCKREADGRVALVTGAGSPTGIGFACATRARARRRRRRGRLDHRSHRSDGRPSCTPTGAEAAGFVADLTDREQARAMVEGVLELFGRVDIVVNNAGMVNVGMPGEVSDAFTDMTDDELGPRRGAQPADGLQRHAAARARHDRARMGPHRDGVVGDGAASPRSPARSGYGAAKAGMDGLMRGLALELGPHGVTVNSVAPGMDRLRLADPRGSRRRPTHAARPLRHARGGRRGGGVPRERTSQLPHRPVDRRRRRQHDPGDEGPLAADAPVPATPALDRAHRVRGAGRRGVCVRLGMWQLDRLDGRREFNDRLHGGARGRPRAARRPAGRAAARSRTGARSRSDAIDTGHEVILYGRALDGQAGNHVLTPLVLADGRAIIVDRGWVPFEMDEPPVTEAAPPAGEVEVRGPAVRPQPGGAGESSRARTASPPCARSTSRRSRATLPYELVPWFLQLQTQSPPAGRAAGARAAARAHGRAAPELRVPVVRVRDDRRGRLRDPGAPRGARTPRRDTRVAVPCRFLAPGPLGGKEPRDPARRRA